MSPSASRSLQDAPERRLLDADALRQLCLVHAVAEHVDPVERAPARLTLPGPRNSAFMRLRQRRATNVEALRERVVHLAWLASHRELPTPQEQLTGRRRHRASTRAWPCVARVSTRPRSRARPGASDALPPLAGGSLLLAFLMGLGVWHVGLRPDAGLRPAQADTRARPLYRDRLAFFDWSTSGSTPDWPLHARVISS